MSKRDIIVDQQRIYRSNFEEFGDTPQGTFQNNTETQFLRYSRIIKQFVPQPRRFTIHDIGSGLGDLHAFLINQGVEHEYSGTEIVQEMVDLCRIKYPDAKLYNRDILSEKTNDQYDFVVSCGVFNNPGEIRKNEWKEFAENMITKSFQMCTKGIAFSFLTTHSTYFDDDLYYFSPSKLFEYCVNNLSRFTILDHSYPLYEGTITVFRKEYLRHQYEKEVFTRYFKN